jgi:hypothetical protein
MHSPTRKPSIERQGFFYESNLSGQFAAGQEQAFRFIRQLSDKGSSTNKVKREIVKLN